MATQTRACTARRLRLHHPRKGRALPTPNRGIWKSEITGRYRAISVHQLAMAYWLYAAGHITKRQFRVYLAAHEMHERREYTDPACGPERPLFGLDEIKSLVGGRGSKTADAELRADLRNLGKLGLVAIGKHAITFATSIDQIKIDDIKGFWTMFNQLPHSRRTIPVPRRMLRAMAAGFSRGVTAVVIATMIRSLFWHREQGAYRTDGRTKREWVAEVFGISLRAVTDARTRLTQLGWLIPLDAPQWALNKYGAHDAINVDWEHPDENHEQICGTGEGESASRNDEIAGRSASPDLNSPLPLSGNIKTRRPAPMRAGPAGVSTRGRGGSRKRTDRKRRAGQEPTINDITAEDLSDTRRLLELHRQAMQRGDIAGSEAGRFSFIALAERARAQGQSPPRLFAWLLRKQRFEFITQADEDAASARLREHRDGKPQRQQWDGSRDPSPPPMELTDDQAFVRRCILVARKHNVHDPFTIARQAGWTRPKWDEFRFEYECIEQRRWNQS